MGNILSLNINHLFHHSTYFSANQQKTILVRGTTGFVVAVVTLLGVCFTAMILEISKRH